MRWCGLEWSGSGYRQMESPYECATKIRVHEMLGNYRMATKLVAPRVVLSSVQ
jgi:hypothetical protein